VTPEEVGEAAAFDDPQPGLTGRRLHGFEEAVVPDDERLVVFALLGQPGLLGGEPAKPGDFLFRQVAEAPDGRVDPAPHIGQDPAELLVGDAEHQLLIREVFRALRGREREISAGDEDPSPVLDDEGMTVPEGPPPTFGLRLRLARAQYQRHAPLFEGPERRPGRLERIRVVIEQCAVEVRENEQTIPLHPDISVLLKDAEKEAL
jgi:hypothetical protein